MMTINGKYGEAKIFTDVIDEGAVEQLNQLCDQEFIKNSRIRIMPDVHGGFGCVIGFTADLGNMVIPNIVGVDIGCGMLTVELGNINIDFEKLDNTIRTFVPSGKNVHEAKIVCFPQLSDLHCYKKLENVNRIENSMGTLGGGNHFIELDEDEDGNKYLVIHTGSRSLGKQVADFYQNLAFDTLLGKDKISSEIKLLVEEYKAAGKHTEISKAIKELSESYDKKVLNIPKELCYLTGENKQKYLDDMKICQEFASLNRFTIADQILANLLGTGISDYTYFETVHNYIDLDSNIVRKGAVSALEGEKLLIPINMRDGSLICTGKGNADWNFSAPHGAGRLFSRKSAKETFSLENFKKEMDGIFTTSVSESTLDECPMAYKTMDDIVNNINPTADILKIIKPVYNFKAGE